MHQKHQHFHRGVEERALTTVDGVVMSVVYVTQEPNFTGVIGGYSTQSVEEDQPEPTNYLAPSNTLSYASQETDSPTIAQTTAATSPLVLSTSGFITATASSVVATALMPTTTSRSNAFSNTAVSGSSSTSSSTPSDSSSTGMSVGGKIGLAVGIIFAIGAVAGLILLLLARKKKQQKEQEQLESEKKPFSAQPPIVSQPAADTSPNAPRLSLRPVSSLAPEFIGNKQQKNRLSQGNMLTTISEASKARNLSPMHMPGPAPGPTTPLEQPRTGENPFKDPENPFADPEKALGGPHRGTESPVSPMSTNTAVSRAGAPSIALSLDNRSSGPTAVSFPMPQSQAPPQHNGPVSAPRSAPAPINVPSGNYAELPAAPSPTVAQGPGPEMPAGNVYRILMDFRPTMEDELELRTGQLVRMLHEYDDGWALCIRLDRSQQGVVPRTCLAAKPSKPRPGPGPPPMGPNSRPITPQGRPRGGPGGPQGPPPPGFGGPRPQGSSPVSGQNPGHGPANTGSFNQSPRPLSPGPRPQPQQKRSMSPGPYGAGGMKPMAPVEQRRRSNSVGAVNVRNKRNSPPGPSKLGPGSPPAQPENPVVPGVAI